MSEKLMRNEKATHRFLGLTRRLTVAAAGVLAMYSCSASTTEISDRRLMAHEWLQATVWVQTSAEFEAVCQQAYRLAADRLRAALADPTWIAMADPRGRVGDLPPAVVMDIDDTVLSSSAFQARLVRDGAGFDQRLWRDWVRERSARAIPGARDFIKQARQLGVHVFYITNREFNLEDSTVRNLRAELDGQASPDIVLSRNERSDWTSDKTSRRESIASTHRVVLLVGDDYNDFAFLGDLSPDQRREVARQHRDNWGTRWILIPNPIYGSWEEAIYRYDASTSRREKLRAKYRALDPWSGQ